MTSPNLDSPVRTFFDRLAPLGSDKPDMDWIAGLLGDFAQEQDYWAHHIDALGTRGGARAIHAPQRGPRLLLVHRGQGQMGAIHSHKVWVAIAPISGTETHRRYRVQERNDEGSARIDMSEERHLSPRDTATLLPPDDIHAHGHAVGIGEPAYCLILTGDNQLAFEREQYDAAAHTYRVLPPGDAGDWLAAPA